MVNMAQAYRLRHPVGGTEASRPNRDDYDLEAGENFTGRRGRYSFSSNNIASSRDGGSFQDESGLSGSNGKGHPIPPCESPLKLVDADVALEWKSSWEEQDDDVEKAGKVFIADDCSVVVGESQTQHSPVMLGWKEPDDDDGKDESGAD